MASAMDFLYVQLNYTIDVRENKSSMVDNFLLTMYPMKCNLYIIGLN